MEEGRESLDSGEMETVLETFDQLGAVVLAQLLHGLDASQCVEQRVVVEDEGRRR